MMCSTTSGAADYLTLDDHTLLRQCMVDHYRAGGPGGQKRNKTSSAVRLRHAPTGLVAIAEEDRSQHVNRDRAIRRLRETIALEVRNPLDLSEYHPSDVLRKYLEPGGSLRINLRNRDYPSVVAEVLDVLVAAGMKTSEAAERIGVSTAQLVRFLQHDAKLWARLNRMRVAAGLHPLQSS